MAEENKYVRVEYVAELFGLSVRRIQQLTQEGVIHTKETKGGRRYELIRTVREYISYLSRKAYGREQSRNEADLKAQKLLAEIALKESQGELHRLRTDIAAGKYISVEEVKLDYSRFFVSFKNFAMSLPGKVAGKLNGLLDPVEIRRIESDLRKEIIKLLKGFVIAAAAGESEDKDGTAKKSTGN